MTLIQDSASLATEHASAMLAASSQASANAVAATSGTSTGSDTTGSSSSGGSGAGGTDSASGDDTVQLTAAETADAALAGHGGLTNATAGTHSSTQTSGGTEDAEEQSAAALVEISGVSSLTVSNYLMSVPPNLASATVLTNELTNSGQISYAAASSVYTLLDSSATLALTSD